MPAFVGHPHDLRGPGEQHRRGVASRGSGRRRADEVKPRLTVASLRTAPDLAVQVSALQHLRAGLGVVDDVPGRERLQEGAARAACRGAGRRAERSGDVVEFSIAQVDRATDNHRLPRIRTGQHQPTFEIGHPAADQRHGVGHRVPEPSVAIPFDTRSHIEFVRPGIRRAQRRFARQPGIRVIGVDQHSADVSGGDRGSAAEGLQPAGAVRSPARPAERRAGARAFDGRVPGYGRAADPRHQPGDPAGRRAGDEHSAGLLIDRHDATAGGHPRDAHHRAARDVDHLDLIIGGGAVRNAAGVSSERADDGGGGRRGGGGGGGVWWCRTAASHRPHAAG